MAKSGVIRLALSEVQKTGGKNANNRLAVAIKNKATKKQHKRVF
jgi:hypothetical protein